MSESVRAGAPIGEQVSEVSAVNDAVAIEITRGVGGRWSPLREDDAKICTIDLAVDEQVRKTLASVGNRVEIKVGCAGRDLTHVADAVVVAIGLQGVRDVGAVVGGVGATVAIGIDRRWTYDCDGVVVPARNGGASPEVSGNTAFTVEIASPAPDYAVASKCN